MKQVEGWIDIEELPVRADMKVIRINDPNYGMTQDEIDDRNEFIRCYILSGFETLMTIPQQKFESDFFIEDWKESAFNTEDYYRMYPNAGFNSYSYRIKKIMQEVEHLAILYSCISDNEGRQKMFNRYKILVNNEFRNKALFLAAKYKNTNYSEERSELKEKISEFNRMILQCKKIWEQYAPRDT
jgi:hypothetical protein